VAMSD
jgi:hypothetical protein